MKACTLRLILCTRWWSFLILSVLGGIIRQSFWHQLSYGIAQNYSSLQTTFVTWKILCACAHVYVWKRKRASKSTVKIMHTMVTTVSSPFHNNNRLGKYWHTISLTLQMWLYLLFALGDGSLYSMRCVPQCVTVGVWLCVHMLNF